MSTTMTTATMKRHAHAEAGTSSSELNFGHLRRMVTEIGIWQHSAHDVPNPRHGYSIDDVARALIVGLRYSELGIETEFCKNMSATCFDFIKNAALKKGAEIGKYHNFCDADGAWLDSIGSEDSFGRTFWGLGVAHAVDAPFAPRRAAERLMQRSLPCISTLGPVRSKAFTILGLAPSRFSDDLLIQLADDLCDTYEQCATPDWRWFEDGMTYCNARLPQALLQAAAVFPEKERWQRIGVESLDFLLQISHTAKGGYSPVGNRFLTDRAWFLRGEKRPPVFDQQPVDAGALVEACVDAYRVSGAPRFRKAAHAAYGWYFGLNVHNIPVYNPADGGVADAITPTGISRNLGAESVLSIHLAHLALKTLDNDR
jgi:hypothetical protein